MPGQLGSGHVTIRHTPTKGAFERFALCGTEAASIAVDRWHCGVLPRQEPPTITIGGQAERLGEAGSLGLRAQAPATATAVPIGALHHHQLEATIVHR